LFRHEQASAWLAGQPPGASRDQGTLVLALKTVSSDPRSALEWVATIGARERRNEGIDGLLEVWLKQDPKAARAWVQESDRLSDADRSRLLERTGR
jgi:hypothetical protein